MSHEDGRDHAPSFDKLAIGNRLPIHRGLEGSENFFPLILLSAGHATLPRVWVSSHSCGRRSLLHAADFISRKRTRRRADLRCTASLASASSVRVGTLLGAAYLRGLRSSAHMPPSDIRPQLSAILS